MAVRNLSKVLVTARIQGFLVMFTRPGAGTAPGLSPATTRFQRYLVVYDALVSAFAHAPRRDFGV